MYTWITICDTCKREDIPPHADHLTHGEILADLIETAAATVETVKTRRVSCLMGCKHGCNIAIQGPGKLAYTLGDFTPTAETAEGIVAYAQAHATSETGQVPYRTWPQAVKGHFVTRHPPLPTEDQ